MLLSCCSHPWEQAQLSWCACRPLYNLELSSFCFFITFHVSTFIWEHVRTPNRAFNWLCYTDFLSGLRGRQGCGGGGVPAAMGASQTDFVVDPLFKAASFLLVYPVAFPSRIPRSLVSVNVRGTKLERAEERGCQQ